METTEQILKDIRGLLMQQTLAMSMLILATDLEIRYKMSERMVNDVELLLKNISMRVSGN